jgi:N-acetylglucosamine-6-phosphate deacetylase
LRALRGTLITPFKTIENGQVEFDDKKIRYIGLSRSLNGRIDEYGDSLVTPGFIDIHIHGLGGFDAMDSEANSIQKMSSHLVQRGVTGFLPTLQTAPHDELLDALDRAVKAAKTESIGAKVLGIHLEGPYLNREKIGAQREYIREPTRHDLEEIIAATDHTLKIVTLAPEVKGGLNAVRLLTGHNILVSAGHTNASYLEACQAFEAGVSQITHLWNGMRGIHQREPGIIGAGLTNENVMVELIADCQHVHPLVLGLTVRLKGANKVALVSDSIKPAGLPDGDYIFEGRKYHLNDGLIKLSSGVIAGSSICLDDAIRNMVEKVGVKIPDAIQMATDTPAKALGLQDKGRLETGYDADIVVMDQSFHILETIVKGKTMYKTGE